MAESPIFGRPSAISEAARAPEIPLKPRSFCGKLCASRTQRRLSCCPNFMRVGMAFRKIVIRRGCCWSRQPSAALRWLLTNCVLSNSAAVDKNSATKSKRPRLRGLLLFVINYLCYLIIFTT